MPVFLQTLLTPGTILHLGYAFILWGILRLSRPVYVAFRKRRAGYGVVFNSVTGQPESLVAVRLVTAGAYGQTSSSAVSDKDGRYRLAAKPGEYLVEATKAGFGFPSKYLNQRSSVYDNILPSAHIIVKDYGVITKNIPLDPLNATGRSKIFRGGIYLGKTTQYLLAYGSPFLLVWYPYFQTSWLAWGLFTMYMIAIVHRMFTYKPAAPAFGTIRDNVSHEPVEQVVARIFTTKFNKLLETQITGPHGRYAFVVHPGSYYLLIKKPGYRSVRINFPAIKQDGFVMAKDVVLTRAPKEYVDEQPEPTEMPTV